MIFTPPRFVAIDDKPAHLKAILDAFQLLGAPCMGIRFLPEAAIDPHHFHGVRAIFADLHLVEGTAGSDNRRHYAQIAAILEDNISATGGPFVLVIWSEHPQLETELNAYLDENLDTARPWCRPLGVLSLAKESFINLETGTARADADLRAAVTGSIAANPQLSALLSWEADVLSASGATLSALLGLVPAGQRSTATFSPALDAVLSRLAIEAVGRPNVEIDPRAAIGAALAPILADRIQNQTLSPEATARWAAAVTRHGDKALPSADANEAGAVNRMLHLALPGPEAIRSTDWGAVVDMPADWWTTEGVQGLFGVTQAHLLGEEFKVGKADRASCRPCLVRIGANCDHAQAKKGPLTYLVGLEIPASIERKKDKSDEVRPPASEWASPIMTLEGVEGAFQLHVNCRYRVSLTGEAANGWQVRYRLREQLCMHLVSFEANYASRPAIVQLSI